MARLPDLLAVTDTTAPTVAVTHQALSVITDECTAADDGCETGGILLGVLTGDTAEVRHAGRPGPAAVRTPTSFVRDLNFSQAFADAAWAVDRSQWIGEWHTHPGMSPTPSTTDAGTYADLLADPQLRFAAFISVILTPHPDGPVMAAWWCSDGVIRPATLELHRRLGNDPPTRHRNAEPHGDPSP